LKVNNNAFSNGETTVIPTSYPNFPHIIRDIDGFLILDHIWVSYIYHTGRLFQNVSIYINHVEDYGIPTNKEVDNMIKFIDGHKKVAISCIGGHGRTGIILAIWCGLNGAPSPIEYVREHYSKKAIETKEQEEFVINYLREKRRNIN